MTTAHKTELERYSAGSMVGVSLKDKKRIQLAKDLLNQGYLEYMAEQAGYKYYKRIKF